MPTWTYRVDLRSVFHDESMSFEERRDAVVRIIRASPWAKGRAETVGSILDDLLEELGDTGDGYEFDRVWGFIYDEADADRAWLATF